MKSTGPRVLLVKMSSLGDLIHVFPAITELVAQCPGVVIDWVVEEAFAAVPSWHSAVHRVIPIALRRWRKSVWQSRSEVKAFLKQLRHTHYDIIIDAQGLIKSAIIARLAHGKSVHGFSVDTLREPIARFAYDHMHPIPQVHVAHQYKALFAQAMGYKAKDSIDYAVNLPTRYYLEQPYVFCFHGTTWETKHWPVQYWQKLIAQLRDTGYKIILPWGNALEHERAMLLQKGSDHVEVLPKHGLTELVQLIRGAAACISVDTGLGHIAAACNVPTIFLFGPTDGARVGGLSGQQINLQATYDCVPCHKKRCLFADSHAFPPCYLSLSPNRVADSLIEKIGKQERVG
jgi:heptosyltransferase-1